MVPRLKALATLHQSLQFHPRPRQPRRTVLRAQGLPAIGSAAAEELLRKIIDERREVTEQEITSNITIVPSCFDEKELTALLDFPRGLPGFLKRLHDNPLSSVQLTTDASSDDLSFDAHFHGFTQLYETDPLQPIAAESVKVPSIEI